MLSERERRQLATIEQDLARGDPGLSALFTGLAGRQRWLLHARWTVGVGVVLMVIAVPLSLDAVFAQGLAAAFLGAAWWTWIVMPPSDASAGDGRGRSPGRGQAPGRW
jgi:hypothetical protein